MDVTVQLFAIARDLAGASSVTVSVVGDATASAVIDELLRRCPRLAPWKPYLRIAVNRRYAEAGQPVAAGDEVAVIPPVSGG